MTASKIIKKKQEKSLLKMRAWDSKKEKMYFFFDLIETGNSLSPYKIKSFIKNFNNFSKIMLSLGHKDQKDYDIYQYDIIKCVQTITLDNGKIIASFGELFVVDYRDKQIKVFSKLNKRSIGSFGKRINSKSFVIISNLYTNPEFKKMF
jgi:hypothetical protein